MTKKNKLMTLLSIVIIVSLLGTISFAEEETTEADKPKCDASLTFYSKYVWRGFELSKNSLVIFPEINVSYKGFGFTLWGDFDTDYYRPNSADGWTVDENNDTRWWETDMVLTYNNSFSLGGRDLSWTLGWIYYDVDTGDDEELFIVLGYDIFLSPEISIWRGIEYGETWYYNIAISHTFELKNGHSIDVGGWIGYNDRDGISGDDYKEWHDATIWAGYNIPINEWCTITPSVNYSFPVTSDAEDYIEAASFNGDDSDWFYGGVSLSVSF